MNDFRKEIRLRYLPSVKQNCGSHTGDVLLFISVVGQFVAGHSDTCKLLLLIWPLLIYLCLTLAGRADR